MTKIKMSKIRVGNLKFLRLFTPFFTSCRLCASYYFLTLIFCKRGGIGALRYLVVASGVLDVRAVRSVDDLNVAVLVLGDDSSGLLVAAVFNELDAGVEIHLEWIGSAWK